MEKTFLITSTSWRKAVIESLVYENEDRSDAAFETALNKAEEIQRPALKETSIYRSYQVYDFQQGVQINGYLICFDPCYPWAVIGPQSVDLARTKKQADQILNSRTEQMDITRAKRGKSFLDEYGQLHTVIDLRKPVHRTISFPD